MAVFQTIGGALGLVNKVWDAWRKGFQRRAAKKRLREYENLEEELERQDDKESQETLRRLFDDE